MNKNFQMILLASIVIFASVIIMAPFGKRGAKPKDANQAAEVADSVGCTTNEFSGRPTTESLAYFDGVKVNVPALALAESETKVLGVANEERWIEVDLSDQMLYAWEGNQLFVSTPVSTGLPWTPTPTGEFRIWIKLRATKMEGGQGAYYYYLPNVPYTMFFENAEVPGYRGYGLHGTYWHNDFGTPHSHGCVNLPTNIAEMVYYWASPDTQGKNVAYSSDNNLGTRIVIHE